MHFYFAFWQTFWQTKLAYFRLPEITKQAGIWSMESRVVVILCRHKKREKPLGFSLINLERYSDLDKRIQSVSYSAEDYVSALYSVIYFEPVIARLLSHIA